MNGRCPTGAILGEKRTDPCGNQRVGAFLAWPRRTRKNKNTTLQNMTHFITQTHHTNPSLPTSVAFLMIDEKLLIAFWRRVFHVSDLSAFDGRVLAYHGSDGTANLEREPEKRLPQVCFV